MPAHTAASALTTGQCYEHSVPAQGDREARHAVPREHAAEIADAVDDARGGGARLLAAEIERERAAEIGVGPEQAEGDQADRDEGKQCVRGSRLAPTSAPAAPRRLPARPRNSSSERPVSPSRSLSQPASSTETTPTPGKTALRPAESLML